ncbi:MAG: glycosyltransferase family 1 protein [Acidobacteria bacterium]|nr:glycosyltransferase family 1 protein [Acidobacteriota bacterium]
MRILVDYRPALRQRTGVGEYMHNLVRAYTRHPVAAGDDVAVFTSSWKDRPAADLSSELGARVVDRRLPVRLLNYAWHRLEWPPIEMLGVTSDIVHAAHPLLIPSTSAAQVVTVHDLFFLTEPRSTRAEVRRDYPDLAARHVRRADAVVANSHDTASQIARAFGVDSTRIHVCSPGPPAWQSLGRAPNVPPDGYVLFVGTLEARKNIGVLLDAYAALVERDHRTPPLVLAGRATPDATGWLDRLSRAPLAGRVRHLGYVPDAEREATYAGARLLVMPSRYEGFGIPVLEAMSAGVPVVAADRGALPEVLGDAGTLVDPDDAEALATAMHRSLTDDAFATACAQRGLERAREFSWERAALTLHGAYEMANANRRARGARASGAI